MADEKTGKGVKLGAFQLGGAYDEVGPELGHLYEARHAETQRAALVLMPCTRMDWQLEASCQIRLSSQREPVAVTLEVEDAPASVGAAELANMLVLMSSALSRVEDNPQVETHLRRAPSAPRKRWMGNWGRGSLMGLAVLILGVGTWLPLSGCMGHAASGLSFAPLAQPGWFYLGRMAEEMGTVSYPLPSKPLEFQATVPCRTKRDEVEINGGCWVELARRPPCIDESQAEHQGRCYMPVMKSSPPLRSVRP